MQPYRIHTHAPPCEIRMYPARILRRGVSCGQGHPCAHRPPRGPATAARPRAHCGDGSDSHCVCMGVRLHWLYYRVVISICVPCAAAGRRKRFTQPEEEQGWAGETEGGYQGRRRPQSAGVVRSSTGAGGGAYPSLYYLRTQYRYNTDNNADIILCVYNTPPCIINTQRIHVAYLTNTNTLPVR
jgi:hypothetical protein